MTGVIIAMQCEADILLRDMQIESTEIRHDKKIYVGKAYGRDVVLIICGIGKVNAACGAQMALDLYRANILLNFGVAGGVSAKTEIAAVYQIEKQYNTTSI